MHNKDCLVRFLGGSVLEPDLEDTIPVSASYPPNNYCGRCSFTSYSAEVMAQHSWTHVSLHNMNGTQSGREELKRRGLDKFI